MVLELKDKKVIVAYIYVAMAFLLKLYNCDVPIFWDSIDCLSRTAHLIYDNDMRYYVIDPKFDNGDPHILPYYLAFVWSVFGKSLLVSHLAFMPFAIGSFIQMANLSKRVLGEDKCGLMAFVLGCAVMFCDTSFLSQMMLVSVDVCVVFFSLYTINKILAGSRVGLIFGFMGLIVTRRGMLIAASLMVVYFLGLLLRDKKRFLSKEFISYLLPLVPTCLAVLVYVGMRMYYTGWIFTSEENVWAGTGEAVGIVGIIKNCVVYVWQNMDFGRIVLWGVFFVCIYRVGLKRLFEKDLWYVVMMYIVLHLVFVSVTIPLSNSFGERYFIVHFVLFSFIVCRLVSVVYIGRVREMLFGVMLLCLLGGNFTLYPETIKTNWECTLKHLTFHALREDCFEYLEEEGIPLESVSSGFSVSGRQDLIFINDSRVVISSDKNESDYYLYSNVCNESDEMIYILREEYERVKRFDNMGVFIELLKKR